VSITIQEIHPDEIEPLIPLLTLAEPSERGLRWGLAHLVDTVYRMEDDGQLVGAATLRWRDEPCEIQELAIAEERQGQGLGKRFVAWLLDEARRRGKQRLVVGTANSSIQNIAFYQKCGLRMDHVRRDYFRYYREPIYENGIQTRDMLVFSYDLSADDSRA
jgi:GNAT superfamily N-acetyltransferase